MTWRVEVYRDRRGISPVEEFIRRLPAKHQARIAWTVALLQEYGLDLALPYARHLEGKLWELRIRAGRSAYRIIYFAHIGQRFVLLHAFSKKGQKTPRRELEIARRRLEDYLEREEAG